MVYRILLVEDDADIANSIKNHLEKWGYQVWIATDFQNVVAEISNVVPNLILLDIMLPYYNGFYWCKEIRKLYKIPIVFISSESDNMNIIMAMDVGGDDFIVKPFELSVLTAKVGAILRRSYSYAGQVNCIEHMGVIANLMDLTVTYCGRQTELSKNEFKIFTMLMENAGNVVSRDSIMMELWNGEDFIDDNTLTVNITRIRKKLKDIGIDDFVKTKKGIGYIV